MKMKTAIYVYYRKYDCDTEGTYQVYSFRASDSKLLTFVCEQEVEIEVPDNYDPTAQKIAALGAEKAKVMADVNETVMKINARIRALEYTP
jgi:hypothetical protein